MPPLSSSNKYFNHFLLLPNFPRQYKTSLHVKKCNKELKGINMLIFIVVYIYIYMKVFKKTISKFVRKNWADWQGNFDKDQVRQRGIPNIKL